MNRLALHIIYPCDSTCRFIRVGKRGSAGSTTQRVHHGRGFLNAAKRSPTQLYRRHSHGQSGYEMHKRLDVERYTETRARMVTTLQIIRKNRSTHRSRCQLGPFDLPPSVKIFNVRCIFL